jgi:hypothetical protein
LDQHRLNVKKHLAIRVVDKALRSEDVVLHICTHGECGLNVENHTWMRGKKARFLLRQALEAVTSRLRSYNDFRIHVLELDI